jgi:hypothetical protein
LNSYGDKNDQPTSSPEVLIAQGSTHSDFLRFFFVNVKASTFSKIIINFFMNVIHFAWIDFFQNIYGFILLTMLNVVLDRIILKNEELKKKSN